MMDERDDDAEAEHGLVPYVGTLGDDLRRLVAEHEAIQAKLWNPVWADGCPRMPGQGARIEFLVSGDRAQRVRRGEVDLKHRFDPSDEETWEVVIEADGEVWFMAQVEQYKVVTR